MLHCESHVFWISQNHYGGWTIYKVGRDETWSFFFRCSLIQEWSQANKWWFQNICRGFTLPNNSHHQDFYSTFLVGDHCKPWFATVIGKGLIFVEDPWLVCLVETTIRSSLQKGQWRYWRPPVTTSNIGRPGTCRCTRTPKEVSLGDALSQFRQNGWSLKFAAWASDEEQNLGLLRKYKDEIRGFHV